MPVLCSFREFLATGALGGFTLEMNLMEVARLLGAPQYWMAGETDAPYPLYWGYDDVLVRGGPSIEISFKKEPPHAMNWFQFEHANRFTEAVHLFGNRIAVSMDGFTGETRVSELISSGVWDPQETKVYFKADIDMLLVSNGLVEVAYMLENDESDNLDEAQRETLQEAFGHSALFGEMDTKYILNSIHSYPAGTRNDPSGKLEMSMCSGEQYLRSIAG